uniref:Putative ovule protein n=1 Tax=Solanum chacoense TaxID=4108 RepID=A0A0V0GK19_SOLCH
MPRPKRGFNQNGKNNKSVKNKLAEVTQEPKDEWLCKLCDKMISAKITTANVHRGMQKNQGCPR